MVTDSIGEVAHAAINKMFSAKTDMVTDSIGEVAHAAINKMFSAKTEDEKVCLCA